MGFIATLAFAQNPLISSDFSADPTARVFEGRVYLYPSHDIPPVDHPNQRPDWFCMADYHCYSSVNLTDWTDHGVILDQKDVPWGNPEAYSMWAPDCVQGKDGRYYLYFPDAPKPKDGAEKFRGFGIGVAISDKPYGPFTAETEPIKGTYGIDPCVLQAPDGNCYLFWGGGGIVQCKLKDNMLELDGTPERVTTIPEGFVEGPFAFYRNGKYYLSFPWVRHKQGDKKADGTEWENPTETLAYCMSDSPMGPWEFKGVIMEESPTGCWTNHHSMVEYNGQWYLFYHHNDYSPNFDKNRSVCADSLFFNADGTIAPVRPTRRGIGVTDARGMVQMDRANIFSDGATIVYNDNAHPNLGWKLRLEPNASATYGNVQMPQGEYTAWANVAGMYGRKQLTELSKTTLKLEVTQQGNGLSALTLTNTGDRAVEVDWISLSETNPQTLLPRKPLNPLTRGGLETGVYRNLFLDAGYTEEQVENKLHEVWYDVMEGPNRCYFTVGDTLAYISDIKNDDVRTEGMSYGMMIAVQWNKKEMFDRLWRWSKRYMLMQDGPMKGYFRWSCKRNGEPNAQGPASDGELYFITSLLFASNQWGNNTGINYLKEAQNILETIQPKEVELTFNRDREGNLLAEPRVMKRVVALMDTTTDLISFVPGLPFTDPSYHLPAFYEVWARYAEDGRASYWRECARKSREYLHRSIHPFTALNPDNNNFDGSLLKMGFGFGDAFRYDSWRVPMNIALDYSWSCSDQAWQQNYGETFQNFLYSQGIDTYLDQYNLDGTLPEKILRAGNYPEKLRHSIGLMSTAAAASLLCSHPKSYEFIDRLWNAKHQKDADGYFDAYYDGLLRLFAFMHLSGRYRVVQKQMQLEDYFQPASNVAAQPDENGFMRRWLLLDPIDKPNSTNNVFVDSYLRKEFTHEYFKGQTSLDKDVKAYPKDGQKVKVGSQTLQWHAYDSQLYNVKLYRFSSCQEMKKYGVLFWATTVIYCEEDIPDVRLSVGSNSASMWWLNGEEALLLSGDRRMVVDDGMSARLTLHKGRNVLRGAIINGPGMSDFCVRFYDKDMKPITNINLQTK